MGAEEVSRESAWHKAIAARDFQPGEEGYCRIQWKGTNVCMDVHCICGIQGHVDAEFAYFLKCKKCGRTYSTGCNVKMIELMPDELWHVAEQCIEEFDDEDEVQESIRQRTLNGNAAQE